MLSWTVTLLAGSGEPSWDERQSRRERLRRHPMPALRWLVVFLVLCSLQIGMLLAWLANTLPVGPAEPLLRSVPVAISPETIPNEGYYHPENGWQGTVLGLSPAWAWALRTALIYLYAAALVGWLWSGYLLFRAVYRVADWTPRDDVVDRLRGHTWGMFGLVVVFAFLVMAVFAPVVVPADIDQNLYEPFSHEISYYDDDAGEVQTVFVGDANLDAASDAQDSVGPMSYDQYDRFHPFGTMDRGQDLFVFMAYGARISLFIGVLAVGMSVLIAGVLAVLSAYYKGALDLAVVLGSDSVQAMPQLLVIILLSVVFADTWLASIYSGGLLLALIFGLTGWPSLWRAVRGPALQVSDREWVDAARSMGQHPWTTMRRHMSPYLVGYLLVYGSMGLGGVIIGVAGLSFLGLGVNEPTPEWGRAVDAGQPYVVTSSWHISLIPGLLVVLVVTAFNAVGDGIRDAIDPEADVGGSSEEGAVAGGGGG